MRNVFVLCAGLLALSPSTPGLAQDAVPAAVEPAAPTTPEQRLDKLFSDLKRERNERAAERIASRISDAWNNSGSASIDLMMLWSRQAIEKKKFDVALDFLDQVVTMKPDYSEGWNARATAHFLMNNYSKSMADINRTLMLEPRHFGALAGMAQILQATGHKEASLTAWQRVLDIYPMMRNAQTQVATLSDDLSGEGI